MAADRLQNIPEEMRSLAQWVCHDAAKRPINPRTGHMADVTKSTTWGTFDEARIAVEAGRGLGIGFVFTDTDPYTGIDLDIPEGGKASPLQEEIYGTFVSYAERSLSGRGLHIIVKGRVPTAIKDTAQGVEVYSSGRYFTVTGDAVRNERPLDMQEALDALKTRLRPKSKVGQYPTPHVGDDALLAKAFTKYAEAGRYYSAAWRSDADFNWSDAYHALLCALCEFSTDEAQVRRVAMASPLVQGAAPKNGVARTAKAHRLWTREYASASAKGAEARAGRQGIEIDLSRQLARAMPSTHANSIGAARFRVLHVSELSDREPSYLIEDLIEEHTYNVIFGSPGSGKTFAAIDMAASIATGRDYHGKAVQQGGVVYVLGEGVSGFTRRTKAWATHSGVPLTRNVPLFVVPAAIEMLNAEDVKAACEAIVTATAGRSISAIMLDTLARNFGDGDENSTKDMNRFNAAVSQMMERFSCAVMVIHHSGHENPNRARGARSLLGAVDAEFRIDKQHDIVTLTHTKSKEGPEHAPITFGTEFVELGKRQSDGEAFGSLVLVERQAQTIKANKLSPTLQRAMKAFEDAAIEAGEFADGGAFLGLHRNAWRAAFYKISPQANEDAKRKAFQRACNDLVDKGELAVSDDVFAYAGSFAFVQSEAISARKRHHDSGTGQGHCGTSPIGETS